MLVGNQYGGVLQILLFSSSPPCGPPTPTHPIVLSPQPLCSLRPPLPNIAPPPHIPVISSPVIKDCEARVAFTLAVLH